MSMTIMKFIEMKFIEINVIIIVNYYSFLLTKSLINASRFY